ncbi:TPA: hypothetical protein ACUNCG_000549 [Aeromonas hydrophila]
MAFSLSNWMTVKLDDVVISDNLESISGGGIESQYDTWFRFNQSFSDSLVTSGEVTAIEMTFTLDIENAGYKALDAAAQAMDTHKMTILRHPSKGATGGEQQEFTVTIGSKTFGDEINTRRTVSFTAKPSGAIKTTTVA